jgi:hypothetical protein
MSITAAGAAALDATTILGVCDWDVKQALMDD